MARSDPHRQQRTFEAIAQLESAASPEAQAEAIAQISECLTG